MEEKKLYRDVSGMLKTKNPNITSNPLTKINHNKDKAQKYLVSQDIRPSTAVNPGSVKNRSGKENV